MRATAPITWASDGFSALVGASAWLGRLEPVRLLPLSALGHAGVGLPALEAFRQPRQADLGVADERQRVVLGGVVGGDVERDDLEVAGLEQSPGAGGEVLEARADGEQQVGVAGERVRRRRAGDADRAEGERMGFVDRRLARLRDRDRNPMRLGESLELGRGLRVERAAAGDDHRPSWRP